MPQPIKPVAKVEGTGSVWNTGSYHWEEKSVGKWAEETIRAVLSCFEYSWNDAKLRVTEVKDLKGEAGVSIRKGKKIISYDYACLVQWRLSMNAMEGNGDKEICFCTGTYEIPEVCADEEMEDWEVRTSIIEDKSNLHDCLKQMIRGMAPKDLKKQLKEKFVDELAKK